MKFLCDQCKAKYQIADEKAAGKTVRMKCRKCGHLIEVRAAVTETSSAAPAPRPGPSGASGAGAPRPPARPTAPRAPSLATKLASAKPPERPASALAGAFKTSVQRERGEEETSAPFDMADLAPSDEWYVAINGVPVGPIRVAEIRRKAALGAVTEESLCWQEGFDEWRAVRSFPDLALIVREAATSGRSSLPPAQSEGRSSVASPARSPSARPAPPRAPVARPVATPAPPMARSNVVPFTSRLATAERFEEAPDDQTRPVASPFLEAAVVADPFANPPGAAAARAAAAPMVTQHAPVISEAAAASLAAPAPAAKAPPWMAIAMVAAATAFGVTAAIAVFFRPAAAPTQLTTQPAAGITTAAGPAPLVAPAAPAVPASAAQAEPIAIAPEPTALPGAPRSSPGANGAGKPAPAAPQGAVATKGPLDLGGLGGTIRPTDDPGDSPKAAGQCFSSGQVSQVIGLHQPGIRRSCWERNPTTKPTVNVSVSLTIGSDGAPQSVSASADEPSVAKCVENDVRTWRFPAMGCSQQTSFSFHFVRQ